MGSEDLFHKRKARSNSKLQREKQERARSKRYLIVCEGSKTEPNYLKELINDLRINQKTVCIEKGNDSAPIKIVGHAETEYNRDALYGDPFDKVFCVFDRDNHETFDEAIEKIDNLKKKREAI